MFYTASVTSKKLPKNDFTRKIKDFDTFTKHPLKCGRFGPNNCGHSR